MAATLSFIDSTIYDNVAVFRSGSEKVADDGYLGRIAPAIWGFDAHNERTGARGRYELLTQAQEAFRNGKLR